jgi:hypothetical protein
MRSAPPCSQARLGVQTVTGDLLWASSSAYIIQSDAMDVHLEVDYETIQLRNPEMKRLSRKVFSSKPF